jgi:hypothetical protein
MEDRETAIEPPRRAVTADEVYRIAEEWAALFNRVDAGEVEHLITEAAVDECFDDRTNLFLMSRAEPTDVALVLSSSAAADDDYLIVRYDGEAWVVDSAPVDWTSLEDAAFADEDDDDDHEDDDDDAL